MTESEFARDPTLVNQSPGPIRHMIVQFFQKCCKLVRGQSTKYSVVSLRLPVRLLSIMVYLYSYLPNGNGSHVDAVQYSAFGLTADTAEPLGAKRYADAH